MLLVYKNRVHLYVFCFASSSSEHNVWPIIVDFIFSYLLFVLITLSHILNTIFINARPAGLTDLYVEVFTRVRKHMYMPRALHSQDTPELFRQTAQLVLVWLEGQLDRWLVARAPGSTITSPRRYDGLSYVIVWQNLLFF